MAGDGEQSIPSRGSGCVAILVAVAFLTSPSLALDFDSVERMDMAIRKGWPHEAPESVEADCLPFPRLWRAMQQSPQAMAPIPQADDVASLRREVAELRSAVDEMRKRK